MNQSQLSHWLTQLCQSTQLDTQLLGDHHADFLAKIDSLDLEYKHCGQTLRLQKSIEMLDVEALQLSLTKANLPISCQYQLITKSTNLDVLKFYEQQHKPNIAICEKQTEGKGRRGNQWVSPFGRNIYCTIGLLKTIQPIHLGLLSILTGLALCRALTQLGYQGIQLKWPNDLYYQGKKLGGILIESRPVSANEYFLAIGFGLNIDMHIDELDQLQQAATCLNFISNNKTSRNQILIKTVAQIITDIQLFSEADIPQLIQEFERIDAFKDSPIHLLSSGKSILATNMGISPTGQLKVKTNQGIEFFSAADISLRSA